MLDACDIDYNDIQVKKLQNLLNTFLENDALGKENLGDKKDKPSVKIPKHSLVNIDKVLKSLEPWKEIEIKQLPEVDVIRMKEKSEYKSEVVFMQGAPYCYTNFRGSSEYEGISSSNFEKSGYFLAFRGKMF